MKIQRTIDEFDRIWESWEPIAREHVAKGGKVAMDDLLEVAKGTTVYQ